VQHKEGGIVKSLLVKDGDKVVAGQDLVILDDTETKAELGIIDALLIELWSKRARLEAQRDDAPSIVYPPQVTERMGEPAIANIVSGQNKLFETRNAAIRGKIEQLEKQVGQLEEEITGLTSQQTSKERQAELIDEELENLKGLQKKGLVPNTRVLALEREQARLEGERGQLVADKARALGRIGEIRVQMISIEEEARTQTLTELRDVEARIAELEERRLAARSRLDRMVIKAPIGGIVYQTTVHTEGGVIAPGEPIMLISPEGDELIMQAQVSPQDIDDVHQGQVARVRFPALKSRFTPELNASVVQVSADTSQLDANSPPFYAVRLKLQPNEIERLEPGQELRPGMPAEAYIQTDARTPMSYLLKPLADQIARAFREH
jgi:HlyD family secretion protein